MRIYLSIDPEAEDVATIEDGKTLMSFLQAQGHTIYRAPYVLSKNPDLFLRKELGLDRDVTFEGQRDVHMKWVDKSDLLIADISEASEGRAMIIQRAIDKPAMGLPYTPIILIKKKNRDRHFGKIVRGLIEKKDILYHEYESIQDFIDKWDAVIKECLALQKNS